MSKPVNRGLIVGLIGVAALVLSTGQPRADIEHTILSLPADNVQFLAFYVAQDTGLFGQQGLEVKVVHLAGVGTTNAVISGSVDFGVSNGASLTRAAAHGQRLLAIAILGDRPTWSILLRKELADAAHFDAGAGLPDRAKAIAGRKIAVDTIGSVAHAYLRVMAKMGGLDPDSITVTPLVATEAIAAFQRNAIDGAVITSPWKELMQVDGSVSVIADSLKGDPPWLTPFAAGLIITRAQFCVEHRPVCMKMGHSLATAAKYVHEHRAEALAILKQRFDKIDGNILERSFDIVEAATAKSPIVPETAVANSDRLNAEAGFIKPDEQLKSYRELFTDEFVR
jgi:NitT/TauT family transport system substrate-binding protein